MTITRMRPGPRMSQIVTHNGTIYLAGQVGDPNQDVVAQTQTCLHRIDALLAEVGSDKAKILSCTIWLADMADFDAMNAVWDAWVAQGHTPARACGEARLATTDYLVEMIVVAAAVS
ncbi:MAG: hypothetical protein COB16_09735 [Rhodobacteraceae bacterium]|nr:MAG: hypothetical protein COB16_09735 [Paracoccaceae bacterium]